MFEVYEFVGLCRKGNQTIKVVTEIDGAEIWLGPNIYARLWVVVSATHFLLSSRPVAIRKEIRYYCVDYYTVVVIYHSYTGTSVIFVCSD